MHSLPQREPDRPMECDRWLNLARLTAVILAAGRSSRMGQPKACTRLPGSQVTFLERIITTYPNSIQVCVVLGPDLVSRERALRRRGIPVFHNPHPDKGPLASLQIALERLAACPGIILHPVDHPLVEPSTIKELERMHQRVPGSILIPTQNAARGHPALFPQRFFPDLMQAPLTRGARHVIHQDLTRVLHVPVSDPHVLANLNDPDALSHWLLGL